MSEAYGIPFTQHIRPNNTEKETFITVFGKDADRAKFIVDYGWTFHVEMIHPNEVCLTVSNNSDDVCMELGPNDKGIHKSLHNLIMRTILLLRQCYENNGKEN